MSQQQPQQPDQIDEPTKYGDVFPVQGDLAGEPVRPGDPAMMQSAENLIMAQTQKGAAASVMQSASTVNVRAGLVGHGDVTDDPAREGVFVSEAGVPGGRIFMESVAGQTITQLAHPAPVPTETPTGALASKAITIGEALEGAVIMQADKPVDQSDAAAIQAAEARATGLKETLPGGVAAAAQSAADINARIILEENKITIGDVLMNATGKLPADKVVTREDAEGVVGAEIRNRPELTTVPGGVADSVTAAAILNVKRNNT